MSNRILHRTPARMCQKNIFRKRSFHYENEKNLIDDELLDYPVYTKPRDFRGMKVPDVLLSGNHKEIEEYRNKERIRLTNIKLNK